MATLRILNLEDDPADTRLIRATLSREGVDCEMVRVATRGEFEAALEGGGFDVILSDYQLPSFDGFSALDMALEKRPEVPFLIVSGMLGEELAIEALKRGATDYVLKDRLGRIAPAVRRAVREVEERAERRRAESARERFFDLSPDLLCVAGMDGHFKRLNSAFEEALGYSREELLARPFIEMVYPGDRAATLAEFERLAAGQPTASFENRFLHRDGSVVWLAWKAVPVVEEGLIYASARDVTGDKRAEEELRRLASFPRLNPNPIIETSVEGEPTYLNPEAERRFPDVRTLGGRHPALADLGPVAQKIRNSHGRPFVREARIGGRYYQQVIYAVPHNGLLRVYSTDVTERRLAEEETRRNHALLDAVVEGTEDPVFVKDPDGRYLMVNSAAATVIGRTVEEVLGKSDTELFPPEVAGPLMERDREVMDTGETYRIEELVPLGDGMRTFLSTKSAYRDHDGRVIGVIGMAHDITERREVEDALREREERFRSLVQHATDIVTVFDAERIVTYESPSVEVCLGYEPGEMIGTNAFQYVHPDDVQQVMSSFAGLMGHPGVRRPIEFRIRHADGSWRYFESVANNLLAEPSVRGIVVNSRDVTERRRAEEALRQSEELYRAVVEQAAENIFLVEPETGRILEANPSLASSLGYSAEELRRMTLYDLVGHDRESVEENIRRILIEKRLHLGERVYRRADGSLVDVEVNTSVISYDGREAFCVVAHDVSERKRAEEALRESEDRFRTLTEATFEGIAITEGGKVLDANRSFCRMFGYGLSEVRGMSAFDFHPPDYADEVWRNISSEHGESYESVGLRKDGSTFDVEIHGRNVSQGGRTVRMTALRDITERKRAEETLREVREAERNRLARDLHDVILQDMIDAMHALEITQMRSGEEEIKAELEGEIGVLERSVMGLRNIVYNLRLAELGGDYPFTRLLEALVSLNRQRASGCEISLEVEDGVPASFSRTGGMEVMNVIREALVNVRRHSEAGKARVTVGARDGDLRVEISDDGRGFELASKKSGVGLFSMSERVRILGGNLQIESRPGEGTRVVLRVSLESVASTRSPDAAR